MTLFILLSLAVAAGNIWLAVRLWILVERKRRELWQAQDLKVKLNQELEITKLHNRTLAKRVIDEDGNQP